MRSDCRGPRGTRDRWLPWRNKFSTDRKAGDTAVRFSLGWVELFARLPGERWYRLVYVCSRRQWEKFGFFMQTEIAMSFLNKLRESKALGNKGAVLQDEKFAKGFPALAEYMTAVAYEDGQERTPCSLTVFAEEGVFKACLSERDLEMSLWGTGETFNDCLRCLEERLKGPAPDWRKKRTYKAKGKSS